MIRSISRPLLAGLLAVCLAIGVVGAASAQQAGPIELTTPFPSVSVSKTDQVTFTINVNNPGTTGQFFDLVLAEQPEGWEPVLKARGFVVRQMYVAPGKSDSFDFQVTPPENVEPNDYGFLLKAIDSGGAELASLRLKVGIQKNAVGGMKLTTQYPTLQGPSSTKFQFKLDLNNDTGQDRDFSLTADAPQGWQVSFKPSYEDKQIASIGVKDGQTSSIEMTVQPANKAPAGDYDIKVHAAGGGYNADADLKVTLTGTYEMNISTPTGRLNAEAVAGQQTPFSVLVSNTGSADLQDINLISSKPDGWDVTFDPETIDTLKAGEVRQVNLTIKPSAKAIAGDYMMTLTASTPQASKNADVRVTVETSAIFGWLAGAVVVIVIGGLYVIFRAYGRR